MVLAFIVFMIISFLIYTDYLNIFYEDRIHPLITELHNKFNKPTKHVEKQFVWTYIEEPKNLNKDINVQLLNKEKNFTILFNFCLQIMNNKINKKYNAFHVISPENIKDYLPDFPIDMNADSKYPLKFRVDLLSSMLLSIKLNDQIPGELSFDDTFTHFNVPQNVPLKLTFTTLQLSIT